ncbi:BcPIO4 [Botrytis cinerea T4]|uniref:BcPIO4 n=1 Tax=Botryotinia fuckeliana (strain T4) TaxID=999810 RepID=G2YIY9_BOTF4|nr:BcPIO4 [Botrytis cinerea T4]
MDKIKALLHGTTPEHEKEVKEEKKAEKIEQKEEKKAEKHGAAHSNAGEGSHLAKGPHSETNPPAVTDASHTSHTTHANPITAGISHASGGLAQDNVAHRPKDSEFGSTATGSNTHAHGIDSAARTHEAGLTGHNTRDPLSSHNAGVPSNTTSGLGGVTSIPSGNGLNTHGRDNIGSHGNSHLGRDAAVGSGAVGAAGLAEHEHRKHENTSLGSHPTHGHAEGSHGTHNSAALNAADPRVDSDLDGNRLPNKTSSGYGTKDAYGTTTTGSSGHHLGRDAAAIGTAGAVGEGIHHHNNQHNQGGIRGTTGPHTTETANRLDPHVSGSGVPTEDAHTHHGHGSHSRGLVEGGGAEEADGVHGSKGTSAAAGVVPVGAYEAGHGHNTTAGPHSSNLANKTDPRVDSDLSKQHDHHYGRDAAVAGAVGGAAYEANKHHHNSANTTAGPHSSNLENKVDPRVDSDLSKQHDHHYGRDAALAGGAGTAAYGADKHHHNTGNATAGPHSSNLENKVDPRVDSDRSKEGHHYGRDAALAGGAAGTAYEANKHHNSHGLDQKPVGKDLGDKLHGVERNRGVNGPTGFPHESGHSTSAGPVGSGVPGAPRGNVQVSDNTHGHNSNIEPPLHNSTGPDHIFSAPVMDDPAANAALREGKIDQHEHRPGDEGVRGVGRDHGEDHSFSTGGGHEHSKSRELDNEINSAPLGNTSGSGLKHDNLAGHNTASAGTTGLSHGSGHNTTSAGTTGLNHGSGLTGHNTTSTGTTGTTGLNHGSGLTGHNTTSTGTTGLNHGSGLTGHNTTSTGTTGLNHGSGLTGHNTTSTGTTGTTGLSHDSGLTGHNTTSTGLNHGSGLTGHNTTSTGTTGLSHGSGLHGSGLTGYNTGASGNNVTGLKHDVGLTGNNTSTGTPGLSHGSGLTGHNTTSSGLNHGSGLTGSTGTHGLSGENRLGETSEFGNTTNNRVL